MAKELMRLGPHRFEVEGLSYQKLQEHFEARWKEHYSANGNFISQYLGKNAEEFTIDGVTFPQEYGGDFELRAVKTSTGKPMRFYAFNGLSFGKVKLLNIQRTNEIIGPANEPIEVTYQIKVSKYGGVTDNNPLTRNSTGSLVSQVSGIVRKVLF